MGMIPPLPLHLYGADRTLLASPEEGDLQSMVLAEASAGYQALGKAQQRARNYIHPVKRPRTLGPARGKESVSSSPPHDRLPTVILAPSSALPLRTQTNPCLVNLADPIMVLFKVTWGRKLY